jgi:hypothetical protein
MGYIAPMQNPHAETPFGLEVECLLTYSSTPTVRLLVSYCQGVSSCQEACSRKELGAHVGQNATHSGK